MQKCRRNLAEGTPRSVPFRMGIAKVRKGWDHACRHTGESYADFPEDVKSERFLSTAEKSSFI
jgi:hypothetical protein